MAQQSWTGDVLSFDTTLATRAGDLLDEATYLAPDRHCDLVMKGGITSGVVYPWAICELARTNRLWGVGGASAGAIAAAGAAAAEYRRQGDTDREAGFVELASVPLHLATNTNLADLFRAQRGGRRMFRVLFRGKGSVLAIAAKEFWAPIAIGAVPGAAMMASAVAGTELTAPIMFVGGTALAASGAAIATLGDLAHFVSRRMPANLLGLCTGMGAPGEKPAITEWLYRVFNRIAGLPEDAAPLTFGHLKQRQVDLRLMVTCLTLGRPYVAPSLPKTFYFSETEMLKLFPAKVVEAMKSDPPGPSDPPMEDAEASARKAGLFPFPIGDRLPVVVAVRMSLSFPILFSPIPLWTIDFVRPDNRRARDDTEMGNLLVERVWFSDGGITSNFPVNLFDNPLPSRPTYAIDLQSFPTGRMPTPGHPENEVWLPRGNNSGVNPVLRYRIEPRPTKESLQRAGVLQPGFGRMASMLSAVINTGRTWADTVALTQPGTRDRVVRVFQADDEGGTNLNMGPESTLALSARGRAAAQLLEDQFHGKQEWGWRNHQWVRFLRLVQTAQPWLNKIKTGSTNVASLAANPPSYAKQSTQTLLEMLDALTEAQTHFARPLLNVPHPAGELQITVKLDPDDGAAPEEPARSGG